MSVAQVRGLSARELTEWEILEHVDPWGQAREDFRAALIAYMLYAVNRSEKMPALGIDAFMPDFLDERKNAGQTPEQQLAIVEQLNAMFGGVDARLKPEGDELA